METLLAVGAAVTVIGAVATILWRVTVGDPAKRNLEKLRDELQAEKSATLPTAKAPPSSTAK